MKNVFFIMQHSLTPDQRAAAEKLGEIVELTKEQKALLNVPADPELKREWFTCRAIEIFAAVGVPQPGDTVHMMGQGQLVSAVNALARQKGAEVIESVTERESVEIPQEDGSVRKTNVFHFRGFRTVYEF